MLCWRPKSGCITKNSCSKVRLINCKPGHTLITDVQSQRIVRIYRRATILPTVSTVHTITDAYPVFWLPLTVDQPCVSVAPPPAWRLVFGFLELAQSFLSLFSQLFVLFTVARTREDGKAMVVICLAKPLYNLILMDSMFNTRKIFITYFCF